MPRPHRCKRRGGGQVGDLLPLFWGAPVPPNWRPGGAGSVPASLHEGRLADNITSIGRGNAKAGTSDSHPHM